MRASPRRTSRDSQPAPASREPRAANQELRAKSPEPRAPSQEPRKSSIPEGNEMLIVSADMVATLEGNQMLHAISVPCVKRSTVPRREQNRHDVWARRHQSPPFFKEGITPRNTGFSTADGSAPAAANGTNGCRYIALLSKDHPGPRARPRRVSAGARAVLPGTKMLQSEAGAWRLTKAADFGENRLFVLVRRTAGPNSRFRRLQLPRHHLVMGRGSSGLQCKAVPEGM